MDKPLCRSHVRLYESAQRTDGAVKTHCVTASLIIEPSPPIAAKSAESPLAQLGIVMTRHPFVVLATNSCSLDIVPFFIVQSSNTFTRESSTGTILVIVQLTPLCGRSSPSIPFGSQVPILQLFA
jgi:hypothetical protein